ncbi:MAG: toxin-antitoxin system HicB family antitoxin [Verrucomicrobia bacterium]|nr:MAG: toxin-antitoxin system HicB family antitoxin [Verrucomicrobiota bacterium]
MKPMQYRGYLGSVECNVEDNCLFGKILYINDLVNYEADSPAGLKQAYEEAVDDYLSTCGQLGKEPEKSFKGSFNVRVSPELHRKAAMQATVYEESLNEFVAQAVREKVERYGE